VAEQANKLAQEAAENLVQERNALAEENTGLKSALNDILQPDAAVLERNHRVRALDAMETPATDAFLSEVRAQGVEMFADKYRAQLTALPTTSENIFDAAHVSLRYQIFDADEFAAQLRKGVAQ
ncbi:Eae-like protein, partial [Salmonella enterica subsp. diarizonae]|nr:Eae-like protein [Salmonella enterica subsp. diarizonae]ECJ2405141.1 Eae-like protein [Salmonella enterica subsp. diarizonae]EDU5554728.1 Eae-like protein [Salmonella enterica subsp. diarizonae]